MELMWNSCRPSHAHDLGDTGSTPRDERPAGGVEVGRGCKGPNRSNLRQAQVESVLHCTKSLGECYSCSVTSVCTHTRSS